MWGPALPQRDAIYMDPAVYEASSPPLMVPSLAYWQYPLIAQQEYPTAFLPLPPKVSPPAAQIPSYSRDAQIAYAADQLGALYEAHFARENRIKQRVPASMLMALAYDAWEIFAVKAQYCVQESPDGYCEIQKEKVGSTYMPSPASDCSTVLSNSDVMDPDYDDQEDAMSPALRPWPEYSGTAGSHPVAPAVSGKASPSLYETALRQSQGLVQSPPSTPDDAIPPFYQPTYLGRRPSVDIRPYHEPCFPNYSDHGLFMQEYVRTIAHLDLGIEDVLLASYLMTRLSLHAYHELVRLAHASLVPRSSTLFAIAAVFALVSNKTLQDSAYHNHVLADIARIPRRLVMAMERVILCDFEHDVYPSDGNWMLWCSIIESRLWRYPELARLIRSVRARRF